MIQVADVLLPLPITSEFTYKISEESNLKIGQLVKVVFRSKEYIGLAVKIYETEPDIKLKEIIHIYDEYVFTQAMISFLDKVAFYNILPKGLVFKMVTAKITTLDYKIKKPAADHPSIVNYDIILNEPQTQARDFILEKYNLNCAHVCLVDGVTGSGKTEVYLDLIAKVINSGKQALVLMPEIVLTSQLIQRFESHFGFKPIVWHSALTEKNKKINWRQIISGKAKFIVGARSALFLPYQNLGVIVVDEEHEASFKQEEGTIYNARDMAIVRGSCEKILTLLCSATPSLETIYNVKTHKYSCVHLKSRFGGAAMPEIKIVDMNAQNIQKNSWISNSLKYELEKSLLQNKLSLLFLNKRGYAPITLCAECKSKISCPNCNFNLVEHRKNSKLQCHYCGFHATPQTKCSHCDSENKMFAVGPGVERIEEEVQNLFPNARIAVITSDTVEDLKHITKVINSIETNEIDIIIGTQMITKGLHFKKLDLVGVIDADSSSIGGDIRAIERTYQLLHQVAGRAGRESNEGIVVIQTLNPNAAYLKHLKAGELAQFLEAELNDREVANMPPFTRIATISISSKSEQSNLETCQKLASISPVSKGIRVLGPSAAPMYYLCNEYRHRFVIIADKSLNLQKVISTWVDAIKLKNNVKIKIDVDPYSFS